MIRKKSQSEMSSARKNSSKSPSQVYLSRKPSITKKSEDSSTLNDLSEMLHPLHGCHCGYEMGISQQCSFFPLGKRDPERQSKTPPKTHRNVSANSSRPETPSVPKAKHKKTQSFSIITPNCADCESHVKTMTQVRKNLAQASKTLYPYRTASFSVQSAQREKELMYQNAGRSFRNDKLSQDILSKSIELNDLTQCVLPKLKREKQFGSSFQRKKDDVVISQDQLKKLKEMLQDYKTLEVKFILFAQKLLGTPYQFKDQTSIPEIFDFLVNFFQANAFNSSPCLYPNTMVNEFASENCKSSLPPYKGVSLQSQPSFAEGSEIDNSLEPSFQASSLSLINEAANESVKSFTESVRVLQDRTNVKTPSRYSRNFPPEKALVDLNKFMVNIDEDDLIVVVDKKKPAKKFFAKKLEFESEEGENEASYNFASFDQ